MNTGNSIKVHIDNSQMIIDNNIQFACNVKCMT